MSLVRVDLMREKSAIRTDEVLRNDDELLLPTRRAYRVRSAQPLPVSDEGFHMESPMWLFAQLGIEQDHAFEEYKCENVQRKGQTW